MVTYLGDVENKGEYADNFLFYLKRYLHISFHISLDEWADLTDEQKVR